MRTARTQPVILFIGVNPKNKTRLRLEEEAKLIEAALQQREGAFCFLFKGAVTVEELRELLLKHRARIIHLSGHADDGGFYFENDRGNASLIRTDALADLFGLVRTGLHCVVISACSSSRLAEAIGQHVPYAIGMRGTIGDQAALQFARGFYDALAHDYSYVSSFEYGCNAIDIKNIAESRVPILKAPEGIPDLRLFDRSHSEPIAQYRRFVIRDLDIAATVPTVLLQPQVIVPLSLRVDASSLERDATWPHPEIVPEETLLTLCCAAAGQQGLRLIVSGDPGSGKTSLLQRVAVQLAKRPDAPLPLYLPVGPILQDKVWVPTWLERRVQLVSPDAVGLSEEIDEQGTQGHLVVLFDGIDALSGDLRKDALLAISALLDRWPKAAFLIAARPYTAVQVDGPRLLRLEIQALSRAQQEQLLSAHLGASSESPSSAGIHALLQELARNPSLRDLAGTCLGLAIIAPLAEQQQTLKRRPLLLLDQFVRLLMTGRSPTANPPFPLPEETLAALRLLAYKITCSTRNACSLEELEAFLFEPDAAEVRHRLERHPPWREGGVRAFLQEQAARLGLLGPYDRTQGGTPPRWRFVHDAFCDNLAAAELKARLRSSEDRAQVAVLEDSRPEQASAWYEPLTILIADADAPDELAVKFGATDRQLGMRLLLRVPHLSATTIFALLGASAGWQQRRQVFARIAELLDDSYLTMSLLDRIRRHTRNGNDLYFIDQAFSRLGEGDPQIAAEVAHCRRQIFAHIPRPAMALSIPTDAGPVPLFCDVPSGEARRAPGSVLAHIHTLRARRGFQISCVPITRALFASFDPALGSTLWRPNYPAVNITWFEATMFCRWLGTMDPALSGARLPREAEWEYACLYGASGQPYCCGDEAGLRDVAWYRETTTDMRRVARLKASRLGIYDLHGNVGEWCEDLWELPASAPAAVFDLDPGVDWSCTVDEGFKALRGGTYLDRAETLRIGVRAQAAASLSSELFGFRVLVPHPSVKP
jgi:hypothetical protein